jgi:molecular chaperone DnaJ
VSTKRDYYEVLGVDRKATEKELKNAFRSKARKFHPDKNPDDPEAEKKFKEVQEAYAILSNPDERQNYDRFGHNRPGGSPFGASGFQGVNISVEDLFGGGFESIFSSLFGGRGGRTRSTRGADLLVSHSITFEQAFLGAEEEIEIDILNHCENCSGSGSETSDGIRECPTCEGRGRITRIERIGPFHQQLTQDCRACNGEGRIIQNPCNKCRGEGRSKQTKKVKFSVPPGIVSGTRLRMAGQGEASKFQNGEPGNLFIEIEVEQHEWFERDGSDLLMALPVNYADLVIGSNIEIPHLDGSPLKIKIPAGSSPGETITVVGRGMPAIRSRNGRGSVMVLLKLAMPKKVSRATKKQLADLRENLGSGNSDITQDISDEARNRRRS